jgi:GNAT superfamily N-acetyltransferase
MVAVTTWFLETRDRSELRRSAPPASAPRIERVCVAQPEFNRFLYTAVGGHWYWRDRLPWSYTQWMAWLDRDEVQTWVMYERGAPAGYVELEKQTAGEVEIAYFGLIPRFIGRGLGGHLLGTAIDKAWDMGATRVWVHTCTLDGPAALTNYRARGMRVFREQTEDRPDPGPPDGPWPGAL